MPHFWENFGKGHTQNHRNLQDGLFQIASQTCSLLVQVNNTNNISYGNNSTNIHCNNMPQMPRPKTSRTHTQEDDQFMVLLPSNGKAVYKPISKSKPRLSVCICIMPFYTISIIARDSLFEMHVAYNKYV